MTTRRHLLASSLPVFAAAAGWPFSVVAGELGQGPEADSFTREMFDEYVALYNVGNPDFARFYTDNIVMESSPPLIGRQAIADYNAALRAFLVERISVDHFVAGPGTCEAQVVAELRCHKEIPVTALGGRFGQAVRPGQVLRQRSIVVYTIEQKRFSTIRVDPPVDTPVWAWPA